MLNVDVKFFPDVLLDQGLQDKAEIKNDERDERQVFVCYII